MGALQVCVAKLYCFRQYECLLVSCPIRAVQRHLKNTEHNSESWLGKWKWKMERVVNESHIISHCSIESQSESVIAALVLVSCPDPALTRREKGLVTIERYLGCAESAVLLLGKPIRLQFSNIPRDIYCNATCVRTRSNHCK